MFKPKRVLFEPDSFDYQLGKELFELFTNMEGVEVRKLKSSRVTGVDSDNISEGYVEAKKTMVVAVRKSLKFQTCKPSAHYQLPLVSSCPGLCEYCYLQTTLGKRPYIKVYVNTDEILNQAQKYIEEREDITIFEGAATSDPLAVEPYTNSLRKAITYFGKERKARFRFVTKFTDVDTLLNVPHNNNTTFRFSLNTEKVIKEYEKGTANSTARIKAANKISQAGYPMGFLIAPIFLYDGWQEDYMSLLIKLKESLHPVPSLSFELITHRYTTRAKDNILEVFPQTNLPMDDSQRKLKFGQFGYTKYVYKKADYEKVEVFFRENIEKLFPKAQILYLV
ncbi:spore photoproduct lyase [Alkalicella caledoniensis]|uniref:Spore photoproduct lyase n=1 Tax=Alkalicella caledoniensis TaxID=2731377 RepID=A0A7G9W4V4_ALKCA|nr:spore photoproduct lyase [Alkalicella caledoniensis]QNO13716.1 spore photoproduct lyase [Alkalicella caledoniensis]